MVMTKKLHLIPGLEHWEHHLANAVDDNDWVVVADLDEHLAVTAGQTIPGFLGRVDQMGYSLVHGEWVDRVAVGPARYCSKYPSTRLPTLALCSATRMVGAK